jgi:hypothetical protein
MGDSEIGVRRDCSAQRSAAVFPPPGAFRLLAPYSPMARRNAALTPEEFACLKEVAVGKLRHDTSPDCKDRLTQLGLIEQRIGDLTLTEAGAKRLAKGH